MIRKKTVHNMLFILLSLVLTTGFAVEERIAKAADTGTDKKVFAELLDSGEFKVSDDRVHMAVSEKANGVMVKGSSEAVNAATFTFQQEFDFGAQEASRLVVDGLAGKRKKVVLKFYLDDRKEAFASVRLNTQKRDDIWNLAKNKCVELDGKNITGKHTVSFRVETDEEKEVRLVLRYLFFMKSDIPTVELKIDETEGSIAEMNGDSEHNTECYGDMTIKVPEGYQSEYSDKKYETATYKLDYIRGRGNSTWSVNKKPYKIKLEKSTDLFGMGKNKHWILLANYYDVSLLRNKFTYWLGAALGMEYTPQCIFTDVVMNGEYLGSYYLCEQVRVGKSRVDIDDLEEDDETKGATTGDIISGGYLMGLSPYTFNDGMHPQFTTTQGNTFELESPAFEDYTNEAQLAYISDYVQKTENAIYGRDFKDDDGISYEAYMDVDAAIDYYLIQEISSNGDAFGSSSTYLYKKRNGKLYWGPLWDFDYVAWGNVEKNAEGFSCNNRTWFGKLLQDKAFSQKLIARWQVVKEKLLEGCSENGQIALYAAQLEKSQQANYYVWNPFHEFYFEDEPLEEICFQGEVERFKKWIQERVAWFDANINDIKPKLHTITYLSDGVEYERQEVGEFYDEIGIRFPEPPVKEGYTFLGWYQKEIIGDKEYENQFTEFPYVVDHDITLYAKWLENSKVKPVEKLVFGQEEYYKYIDDYYELQVYALPFQSILTDITWSSSDEEIVRVSDMGNGRCVVNTVTLGDAVITATNKDGVCASCTIHVRKYNELEDITDFDIQKTTIKLERGTYGKVEVQTLPLECAYINYGYYSSDSSVAEVNDIGYVQAKKAGTAHICIVNRSLEKAVFCKVVVTDKKVKKGKTFLAGGLKYQITDTGDTNTVKCIGMAKKAQAKYSLGENVIYRGVAFKVKGIDVKPFKRIKQKTIINVSAKKYKEYKKLFAACKSVKIIKK